MDIHKPEKEDRMASEPDKVPADSIGVEGNLRAVSTEEKSLVRKLDARILPIACLMYLFACEQRIFAFVNLLRSLIPTVLDRSNIGNAR